MIVGFGHQSRVGKDTCGMFFSSILREQGEENVFVTSFASELKKTAHRLFKPYGVASGQFYEKNPELRYKLLPDLGASAVDIWIVLGQKMREIHPDVWVDTALRGSEAKHIIIRDVRFPNEIERIRAFGGKVIKVTRPGDGLILGSDQMIPDNFKWDYYIDNSGTLKDLYVKCSKLVMEISNEG